MQPLALPSSPAATGPERRVEGVVQRGAGRGRHLGFPTANLVARRGALPAPGVYAGWARIEAEPARRPAMIYVGSAPTFGGTEMRLEAHLLGFCGDLYGRRLEVVIEVRVAAEREYASPAALAVALRRLAAMTRASLGY